MNKAILISIQPNWCELIASGKKRVEVRKTRPKLETPFKVYIYCTNGKPILGRCILDNSLKETPETDFDNYNRDTLFRANGKVIGEFVCDGFYKFVNYGLGIAIYDAQERIVEPQDMLDWSCMIEDQLVEYIGNKEGYGWHISNLVIYDKPKELSEFYTECQMNCEHCEMWGHTRVNADEFDMDCKSDWFNHKPLTRPPQSWMYVEEFSV